MSIRNLPNSFGIVFIVIYKINFNKQMSRSYQTNLQALFRAEEEANNMIRVAEEKREKILEQAIQDAENEIAKLRDEFERDF